MADPADKIQFNVYLGAWTNWSRGRILGATLTLESQYGLLLLSFTATFVGFVASRFWRIVTLMLHRIYSTPEPRDALHHQRQVLLRNSVSAESTLWTSLQLAWCWRAVSDGYLARTLPIIIFAASAFCAFTIAGGFTSSISSGIGTDVLIDGSRCGIPQGSALTTDTLSVLFPWLSQSMNNAANYAQQCYSFNTTGSLDCTTFAKSRLQFTSVLNASCPFDTSICRSNDSNLLLDSGLISSDDLGLNLPSSQRMYYREVLQCAPLRTNGFTSNVSGSYSNYTRYWYGESPVSSWTYEAESLDEKYRRQKENPIWQNTKGFNLLALEATMINGTAYSPGDFAPIPQLALADADVLVVFLLPDGVLFTRRTDDPWYRGLQPGGTITFSGGSENDVYKPAEAGSPMGCAERYQYCNSNKECGSLSSGADALTSALIHFHSDSSRFWSDLPWRHGQDPTTSRFSMFRDVVDSSAQLVQLLNTLGVTSLSSSQHFSQGVMGPLPDNQWQLDLSHWFAMRMASLQAAFVNTARGPVDEAILPYVSGPGDEDQRAMCNSQKILTTEYISLSLFGLYFTYVTGIVVILASYVAEPLLAVFYSRRKYKEYKYLEWAANNTLQLQRLAYQGLGSEKWTNYTDDIPKTRPGYFLADLARAYPPRNDEVQEVETTSHTASTTAPSVSAASAKLCVPEQSRGVQSRPVSSVSDSAPEAISPQAVSLKAVSPQTVSTQAVSPISQHHEG